MPTDAGLDRRALEAHDYDGALGAHCRWLGALLGADLAPVAAAAEVSERGCVALTTVRQVVDGRTYYRAGAASGVDQVEALWRALLDAVLRGGSLLGEATERWRDASGVLAVTVVPPTPREATLVGVVPEPGLLSFRARNADYRVLALPDGSGVTFEVSSGSAVLSSLDTWLALWTAPDGG